MVGFVVALIVAVVAIVGIALFMIRRRARDADVLPPPELSTPVDYTSLPVEEPVTFGDRVRAAPLALKLLAVLLLIGLIAVIGIAYYAFVQPSNTAVTPAGPPPTLTDVSATVANERTIAVRANTNMPDGTTANVVLQENGQPFAWAKPETMSATVQNGRLLASLERRDDAPAPKPDQQYTVVLNANGPNGQQVSSDAVPLTVPSTYRTAFFTGGAVAEAPTTAPTAAPTSAPTAAPTAEPTAEPTAPPAATSVPTHTATVFNGGRIRSAPTLNASNQVGTI
ncbi:MAG TPA: SH3 domain-containing protein, partial [Roseiflexaceae bacterium]|nr:SH3 domain-containing protein [Roseiflexaceae bacterium]